MTADKILKAMNTVQHMTLRQWKYRLYYTARNKMKKRKPKEFKGKMEPLPMPICYAENIDNKEAVDIADGICRGEIPTVSEITVRLVGDWDIREETYRLVSFKLNSFHWLLDLSDAFRASGDSKYIERGFEYIRDWQQKCGKLIVGDKWNAYVIAERITNWIGFCSEYMDENDLKMAALWIFPQVHELKDSLEYQLGANHLLSEAKALLLAGAFLQDEELYETGKRLLFDEAKEQFLPDGGHYERSVSYHVESLQQFFESYVVLKLKRDKDASRFADIMREPYRFLNGMISVNGKIPLFNDAAYDYPFYDAADFLSTASYIYSFSPPKGRVGTYSRRWEWLGKGCEMIDWDKKTVYENTGFVHYQFEVYGKGYSFFMDCGDNGPEYNLGHAHADALSVLLSSEKTDILVDSGVFTYKPGQDRNACRATKAHNTVEVDGSDSAEVWSAFRVARRGYSRSSNTVQANRLDVQASHDGYVHCLKSPVVHDRKVTVHNGKIIIRDILNAEMQHSAVSRYHIGPDCKVVLIDPHNCMLDGYIKVYSQNNIRISDCVVAGRFGMIEKTKCIEIDFQSTDTLTTIFSIMKEERG